MSDAKPAAKNTFTVEEMQIELDAAHLAQFILSNLEAI